MAFDDRRRLTLTIDDQQVECFEGDTVAGVVMLANTTPYRRSSVTGEARAPLCMMGICFECLVEIDGVPNQQGCLRPVEAGMVVRRQLSIHNPARENVA
ncbi:(2Fe-2S)-binding protein (plasmid) [Sinorhizobium mexicanum]|uniref:(2Fe-2S)-binding protein n=2 Tax=Sinorhizobium mexicanum TaxID=375549 RepID=A0A859QEE2_9HYPH|nr:(2Fe-2S)-binding protein [Sinorhizobium mexicanum]QLL64223.1 (2Fe-2S)-binding protein [Sinorhizobium mexicanum]